jgi:lipopolysaccharide/colanic/teichoic acid biosynthesis glycosyltransferase
MASRSFARPSANEPSASLTGPSAHKIIQLVGLRVAPALAGGMITYAHLQSEWQGLLMFVSMFAAMALLLRPRYPLHLIPIAAVAVYLAGPLIGALVAIALSEMSNSITPLTWGDVAASVLGAWTLVAVGAWLARNFRRERAVRLAVIGTPEFAARLGIELEADRVSGYQLVGSISPDRRAWPRGSRDNGDSLGSISELRELVLRHQIELLVLGPLVPAASQRALTHFQAAGPSRPELFELVAEACLDLPVSMMDAGQFYESHFGHVPLGTTNSSWLQYLLHPAHREAWPVSKRLLDLVVGSIAAVIAIPVVTVCAAAIKLSDRGPVFYRQTRIGEQGAEINLVKLRTMRVDADELRERGVSEDELVTGVGKLLRRLHLNELPQLWHVLKGEMSLVGPRPELPDLVSKLESRFVYYDRRHLLKPGVTGWASVRCGYAGTPIGEAWKLCHDLYYLKRRSVLFDLMIITETLSSVILPDPSKRPNERFIVAVRAEEELAVAEAL